jgi:outer membrane protein
MNKFLAAITIAFMLFPLSAEPKIPAWLYRRFHPETVKVRDVEGIPDHIVDGKLVLKLKDFLELVLKNSTAVNLTRLDVYTAADQIELTKAVYDPSFSAGFNLFHSVTPQSSQLGGADTLSNLTQTSFFNSQQTLPTGQAFNTGFTVVRNSSNNSFSFLNPNLDGSLNFSVVQPLLRDRTSIQLKAPIEIARTQLLITSEQSEAHISDLLAAAAGQYWDAIRSRDNIAVLQQTLNLAQTSYERDRKALDLGALASLDIYQSETQVAERNRDLIQAKYTYTAALDGLRTLIGADLTPELRKIEIVLGDDPASLPPKSGIVSYEDALAAALRIRPELSAAHRRLTVDDLNARVARNLLLPRMDLTVQGASAGLAGNQSTGNTGLVSALGQTFAFNYPGYGAGLQITLPLHSRAAQAQLADALVNKTRDAYTERQVQQQITQDVRQAITALDLADASIVAARLTRDLAQKNVEAEQQKYELGSITAFEVLDSQTRLSNAESSLLNSYVGYQQAYISYQRSTAVLLDGLGMVIETPKVK